MVEINSICRGVQRLRTLLLICVMVLLCGWSRGGVVPRFEGLRSDSTYMALLEREAMLKQREGTLLEEVESGRAGLKVGDEKARKRLEGLEFDLFDIQRERSEVSNSVRGIEQRWELQNLDMSATAAANEGGGVQIDGESVGSVVSSRMVRDLLSEGDMALFARAERGERIANGQYVGFMEVYHRMRDLKQLYNQSESEEDAAQYINEFREILPATDSLLMELDDRWSVIYVDKVFIFNLLLETLEREDLLLKGEEILRNGGAKIPSSSDDAAIVAVTYDAQKRALLQYELLIAEVLKLNRAVDSLRNESVMMAASGDVEPLRDVEIRERNFIDYEDIKFASSPKYKSGQIPEAKLYEKGTIYRIQMGAYKTSQNPSVFRGAYPLSFDKSFGFWTYYTGAYATMVEAQRAQELCKKRGFNRPEIVVWRDGVRRNLGREPLPATKGFRVVITSEGDLSEGIEAIIKAMCSDAQITRVGAGRYIVGDINHPYIADELVEAMALEDDGLTFAITEIE